MMFTTELKFFTSDESILIKNGDLKSYKYETKKRGDELVYDTGKRSYCERRGGSWRAQWPRQIRQLVTKLRDRCVVHCEWSSDSLITIVFSSGAIAYLTLKPETLDVTQVLFDRYCVGRLTSQMVTGVVLCKSHLLLTHADRTATLVSFGKSASSQPSRMSDRDPQIQIIELGGGTRRSERKVSSHETSSGVCVLVWGTSAAEPAPWSPALEDVANLHFYQFTGPQVTLLAYHQLENDTLSVELAYKSENIIHVVEQIPSHKTGVSLNWLRYEVPNSEDRTIKLSSLRESITQATLPAPVRVVRRSPCDTRILAACIDGSLQVIHQVAGVVHSTRAGFIATDVRWAGALVVAAEERGRLQCFDRALAPLSHHNKCLDFAPYFRDAKRLQVLATRTAKGGPLILVSFVGGPLALLRIMHPKLLTAWIRGGRAANAVALLRTVEWDREGAEALWAVNRVVCAALGAGLHAHTESLAQAALGAYLAPLSPHGAPAARLAPAVHDLARKFFHHLLRRGRVEKALSLAVDLSDWDVCCDARHAAARRHLPSLAAEAATLAAHLASAQESECSESCSQCSSHTYSNSEGESSGSADARPRPRTARARAARAAPPPLPRVAGPRDARARAARDPAPTIVHVPISQAEPLSTHSIRPNLHQYLERDTTLWNTAVRDDSHLKNSNIKPILNSPHVKWHSMDNVLSYKHSNSKNGLMPLGQNEGCSKTMIHHDERLSAAHFRHLLQAELREPVPNTLYRYQSSANYHSYLPGGGGGGGAARSYRGDDVLERSRPGEKNKVKFSDTITIAVVPECAARAGAGVPSPARELADSLPLSPPHAYLSAFAPAPPAPAPGPGVGPAAPPGNNNAQLPPKIKVVHFGMV